MKITRSSRRAWECWQFSPRTLKKNIFPARQSGEEQKRGAAISVADGDQEYRRLQSLVKAWVEAPTTQPWGTRSVYFRDPDGNLVDFNAPIKGRQ